MRQVGVVQRYKLRGCLFGILGLVIAIFVVSWVESLGPNTTTNFCGTIIFILIVTPLVIACIKLVKPKAVQHPQDYSTNPHWTPHPINSYTPPRIDVRPYAPPDIGQIVNSLPTQNYSVNPYWSPKIEQPVNLYVPPQTEQNKFNNPYMTPQTNSAPTSQVRPKTRILDRRYIPTKLRRAVIKRDNEQCRRCGSRSYLELDHIIPLSKGGATSYDNLQVLCRSCNGHKGNR